jgi:hypothetical protein
MTYYSQIEQDKYFIENIMDPTKKGFFVDVGMHDGITMSNTRALERLGWKGLGIEVADHLVSQARCNRVCTVVNECVFSTDGEEKTLEIPLHKSIPEGNSLLIRIKDLNRHCCFSEQFTETSTFIKRTKTLNRIFEEQSVPSVINYMSLDIEGSEYDALLGLDFSKYKIEFLTVEWGEVDLVYLKLIQEFMKSKGYNLHRINFCDAEFVPE